ncbi:MAG: glycosyl hydrolase [Verrucomicrobia bacterium]|nr:glycosyl hydrolase [Verrucomicrobiota bacterium]
MMKRLLTLLALTSLCVSSLPAANDLEQGFAHPPDSARPWVYWFWLSGNISSNGISRPTWKP